ncbi:MAG: peptidoglycan-binding protein, partial [Clostridia bacterium]|nr:peptidoglycan-binding protein [Clostridia bacterium]
MANVNDFSPFLGQPIRSVQTYLREIGNKYSEMPNIIPDGIYGPETEASVRWFQEFVGLPVTGIVDKRTWDTILEEYFTLLAEREPPVCIRILPDNFT